MIKQNIFSKISFKKKSVFIFLTSFLIFLALEISLQIIYKLNNKTFLFERVASPFFVKDDYCCYKNKPNLKLNQSNPEFNVTVITDNNGFRVSSKDIKIDSNKKKILFLGPSLSFGQGVNYEDSYAFKLKEYLSNEYELINASIPSHPPQLNLCWYLFYGQKYNPDIIIQNIYGPHASKFTDENDILNFCKSYCKSLGIEVMKTGYIKNNKSFLNDPKKYLKNSALVFYSWFYYEQLVFNKNYNLKKLDKKIGKEFYGDNDLNKNNIIKNYNQYIEVVKKINPDVKVYFNLIPVNFTVSDSYLNRWGLSLEQGIFLRKQYEFFIKIMVKNFDAIDVLHALTEAENHDQTFYNIDVHLTKFGNQIVFNEMKSHFSEFKNF